ncbi:MAG: S-methyl-5-thioribose-1-phosphate isomerase [Candidatus Hydrogenedentota bacterium]
MRPMVMPSTDRGARIVLPIRWDDAGLCILDQTLLPVETRWVRLDAAEAVWEGIQMLRVRGAPAIGCCAAFGVVVGVREAAPGSVAEALEAVRRVADYLATSRPTAVNLFWALDRMRASAEKCADAASVGELMAALEAEAMAIFTDNDRLCRAIGDHGAPLIKDGDGVLTHCNAGPLATGGYGTALAGMLRAHELGRQFRVFAGETRPLLQGARLTAYELQEAGIDVTLICDNVAAQVMKEGRVQLCIVGADRIAANGDTANKIGTYGVAVLAKAHGIPFYVAAPSSTFDMTLATGAEIPIEERDPAEVTQGLGRRTAPEGVAVYSPAFDVTPAQYIAGYITEKGVLTPPFDFA